MTWWSEQALLTFFVSGWTELDYKFPKSSEILIGGFFVEGDVFCKTRFFVWGPILFVRLSDLLQIPVTSRFIFYLTDVEIQVKIIKTWANFHNLFYVNNALNYFEVKKIYFQLLAKKYVNDFPSVLFHVDSLTAHNILQFIKSCTS